MRFLSVYKDLLTKGTKSRPRGLTCLEIQDYQFTLGMHQKFTSYNARKFNLDYAKFEMLWYLTGDKFDESITKSAQMWANLQQPDGSWNSNYGQYWFSTNTLNNESGFDWVVNSLAYDKDTRQAVIPMLSTNHLFVGNKDVVCTECISFRIRDNKLYMSVNMRSQDAMWGLTNDIFCFCTLMEMVYVVLRDNVYNDLQPGSYTHKVDSFHVYEHHFEMLEQIVEDGQDGYNEVYCPPIHDVTEVMDMIRGSKLITDDQLFRIWLNDNRYTINSR